MTMHKVSVCTLDFGTFQVQCHEFPDVYGSMQITPYRNMMYKHTNVNCKHHLLIDVVDGDL